ncbi:MAG TPA: DUF302 domain-containing protein [Pyrinomonadaceae bacterium]|jgi:Uncharacterized conserved protein|nr:DUF302 domain-containing protein [Pyrinomonadaceae bacterium]
MGTRQINIERFSVISAKPFTEVVRAIEAQVGHPDMKLFYKAIQEADDDRELQRVVNLAIGPSGLMEFISLDHGAVLRRELGPGAPNVMRLLIGNPLIMRKMVKYVSDAGSYAPVTILIDEQADGVHLSYDRMASLIAPYESVEALEVARDLDNKVEGLLVEAAHDSH